MWSSVVDWTGFFAGLGRDLIRQKLRRYDGCTAPFPTRFLSPTGLALSCDACGGLPYLIDGRLELFDVSTYRDVPDGGVIWMRIEALPIFNREMLPRMRGRFVLVTGESDWSVPSNFQSAARTLVRSGRLIRWFSVNYDGTAHHEIITPVPIGFDYPKKNELTLNFRQGSYRAVKKPAAEHEAEWDRIAQEARPVEERVRKAVADFHFNDTAISRKFGETRTEIRERLRHNPNVFWPARRSLDPLEQRRRYARHAFVIVTHGRGLDVYRTWEALPLGCIVIVKKSPLDVLYRGLPVVILDEWEEITAENLERWLAKFGSGFDRSRVAEVLSMEHWARQLRNAAAQSPASTSA